MIHFKQKLRHESICILATLWHAEGLRSYDRSFYGFMTLE